MQGQSISTDSWRVREHSNHASKSAFSNVETASSREHEILLLDNSGVVILSLDASYFVAELLSDPPFQKLCPVIRPMMLLPVFYYDLVSKLRPTGDRGQGLVGVREA